jgi:Ca2+:H+ antiporter
LVSASYDKPILRFNGAVADALSSLMIITAVALILPTALYSTFNWSQSPEIASKILAFSRGTALILLLLYIGYLYFQMGTHKHLFLQAPDTNEETQHENNATAEASDALGIYLAAAILIVSATGIIGCTHFFIDSMNSTAKALNVSKTFIAMILIPIISNSAEASAVIATSRSGEVDFAIGVIVSSILQIGLFVTPFLVVLGWLIQQPMNLNFDPFHTAVLFFSVLVVNNVLQDGKYTYIHGAMLVSL